MANSYDLYLGGGRTFNPDTRMFPSAPYNPTALIKAADHKNPIGYAITRVLDPSPTAPVTVNGSVGDPAFRNFIDYQTFSGIPIVQGDILRIVALPNGCLFDGLYWEVVNPLAGFSFSVGFSRIGNGAYVSGSQVIPNGTIGTILLNAQSGATASSGVLDASGTPFVADTALAPKSIWIGGSTQPATPPAIGDVPPPGDCLALRIDALPTTTTGANNWGNLRLIVSPLVRELVRGQW